MVKMIRFIGTNYADRFNNLFENNNYKVISYKISPETKEYNISCTVLYEEINKEEENKNIKDFIIQTIHEEVKSIRDIFQSFLDLKK